MPKGQDKIVPTKGKRPIAPVRAPKPIAQGTRGKTIGLIKKEIKETKPDILISKGKTKN